VARLPHAGLHKCHRVIDKVIGRAVLSVTTANKLGQVNDLVVDPVKGRLLGLSVETLGEVLAFVDDQQIRSIGPDDVMVNDEASLTSPEKSPLKTLPLAKNNLTGVKVVTESGQLLGEIANVYVDLAKTPVFIYEVRSSILDKLVGHALYFPATHGCAFSDDATRLVVSDATEKADRSLHDLAERLFPTSQSDTPEIVVRSHSS
jgi:uncharacterized protein YrrD